MAFKVTLNGSNYVSEERKRVFEQALSEQALSEQGGQQQGWQRQVLDEAPTPDVTVGGNGGSREDTPSQLQAGAQETADLDPVAGTSGGGSVRVDYVRILESLERGLATSYDHQSETVQVHEHYLANEASYASIFSQLMQTQTSLFANGRMPSEQAETLVAVLERLASSLERFHQHQAETLNVHSQFLEQQAVYAQGFVELLQTHYGAVLQDHEANGGNGRTHGNGHNGNGHHPHSASRSTSRLEQRPDSGRPLRSVTTDPIQTREVVSREVPEASSPPAEVVAAGSSLASSERVDAAALAETLLGIVSDKTGYPAEMLDVDMDLEADLGIDSIKRVEILGALQDAHPDLPDVEPEALGELRTLAEILAYMREDVVAKKG